MASHRLVNISRDKYTDFSAWHSSEGKSPAQKVLRDRYLN